MGWEMDRNLMAIVSFTHQKLWFSIALLVYQKISELMGIMGNGSEIEDLVIKNGYELLFHGIFRARNAWVVGTF